MDKKNLKGKLNEIEFAIGVIILVIMLTAASANIIFRYVFNHALNMPDEICRYGLIWLAFMSMPAAVLSGNHLYVDLISAFEVKWPRPFTVLRIFATLVWMGLGAFLAYWGVKSVIRVTEMTQTLGFSMKWIYLSIPVGFAFLEIRLVQKIVQEVKFLMSPKDEKGGEA